MEYSELFIDNNLEEPLDENTLKLYFIKMKNGDLMARDIIITHNIKLVLGRVLKQFENTNYEKSELVSIGIIGLIKGVDTFDIDKGLKFSTYACKCIDNEILMYMRKVKKYVNTRSIDDPLNIDKEGNNFFIEEILSDGNDLVIECEKKEIIKILNRLINELDDREKEIIMLYFGFYNDKRFTEREIGEKLNISRTYVSKIIKRALNKLSIKLKEHGYNTKDEEIVNLNKEKILTIK